MPELALERDEQHLRFRFSAPWTAVHYDSHPDRRKLASCIGSTKGVDFIGILNRSDLYLIEVTDFRGHPSAGMPRNVEALAAEMAQKVRDTLPGIVGGARASANQMFWGGYAKALVGSKNCLRVILWLEDSRPMQDHHGYASVVSRKIKEKLRWLTAQVTVASQRLPGSVPPHLSVSNLPGAGQP